MTLDAYLVSLGVSISSSAIYDLLKTLFSAKESVTSDEVTDSLNSFLEIHGASIHADKIIDVLAKNGDISIKGTMIYAAESIRMASSSNTAFEFGDGSSSATDKTRIDAGKEAKIRGQGGAEVRQNDDGSISFHT